MKSIINLLLTFIFSITSLILLIQICCIQSLSEPIIVDPSGNGDYRKIQDAIDNATESDEIIVFDGTYIESIYIDKSLKLTGISRSSTIIDANNADYGIVIDTNNVIISQFLIRNTNWSNDHSAGIYSSKHKDITLKNLTVKSHYVGIRMDDCKKSEVYDCDINGNGVGISFILNDNITVSRNIVHNNSLGLLMSSSSNISILDNSFTSNNNDGIHIIRDKNIQIKNNYFTDNLNGIFTFSSINLTISGNILNVNGFGIKHDGNNSQIRENEVHANEYGIFITDNSIRNNNNSIIKNHLWGNDVGIYIGHRAADNLITENDIIMNGIGIYIPRDSKSNPVNFNNIYQNGIGIDVSAIYDPEGKATHNWWGDPSGPYHPTENPNGTGDRINGSRIDFDPWLRHIWAPVDRDFSLVLNTPLEGVWQFIPYDLNFTVRNRGTVSGENVVLHVLVDGALRYSTTLNLSANSTMEITIPLMFTEGGEHLLTIVIDPEGYLQELDETNNTIEEVVHVRWKYMLELSPGSLDLAAEPGQLVTVNLTARNVGWAPDIAVLGLTVPDGWIAGLNLSFVPLDPDGAADVRLSILIPHALPAEQQFPLGITAVSVNDPDADAFCAGTLTILRVFGLDLTLDPPGGVSIDKPAEFIITLTNTGNGRDTYRLRVDVPEYWYTSHDDLRVTLDAGRQRAITVSITPRNSLTGDYIIALSVVSEGNGEARYVNHTVFLEHFSEILFSGNVVGSGVPGEVLGFPLRITNSGNGNELVFLRSEGGVGHFSDPVIRIPAYASADVTCFLTVPPQIAGNTTFLNLSALAASGCGSSITLRVNILEHRDLLVEVPASLALDPGTAGTVEISLHNRGNVNEEFFLDLTPVQGIGIELSHAGNISIPAFATVSIRMTVTVPYDRELAGRSFDVVLLAGNGGNVTPFPLNVTISREYRELYLEDGGFAGYDEGINRYSLRLHNEGTVPETVFLSASAPPGWDVMLSSSFVLVAPGSSYDIILMVRAPAGVPADAAPEIAVEARSLDGSRADATVRILNTAPTAGFAVIHRMGRVIFNASGSSDPDGTIVEYRWEIEGMDLTGPVVVYTFEGPGEYRVTLRVTDNLGKFNEREEIITVTRESSLRGFEPESEDGDIGIRLFVVIAVVSGAVSSVIIYLIIHTQHGRRRIRKNGPRSEDPGTVAKRGELVEERVEEVVVVEGEPKAIRPEMDNAMFMPPGEVASGPITGENEVGAGEDGEPGGPDGPGEGTDRDVGHEAAHPVPLQPPDQPRHE